MLTNVASSVFLNSQSVQLLPVVSAEWNQNLFNPPYITVAGNGTKQAIAFNGTTPSVITGSLANPNFTTYSFALSGGAASVSYNVTSLTKTSYKIVSYMKTDSSIPIMANVYAQGTATQFGSSNIEINNYGWTKVEVFIGGSGSSDTISSLLLTLACNAFSSSVGNPNVYYTLPEVYETDYFNYQYDSLWPTMSVFNFFRPGESYVTTGNQSLPAGFRSLTNIGIPNPGSTVYYAPVTSIIQNPTFSFATQYMPLMKNVLPNDISPYHYFVSDAVTTPTISAMYPSAIITNKLVIKFNTLVTTPTISVYLNNSGTASYTGAVPSSGVLVLYYNGSSWTATNWTTIPTFNTSGALTVTPASITQVTVTQNSKSINSQYSALTNAQFLSDSSRMHLIEVSPRLEIDLTQYVEDVEITKALDSKSTVVPLSTVTTDDAVITIAGMPAFDGTNMVPLFSNASNKSTSILANLLRKNIKFYLSWNLQGYSTTTGSYTQSGTYIPAGVFYSDVWDETDIDSVKIQTYDIMRYLQTLPVPDYVANLRTVTDIISNLLDLAGFTDYDYDSLYTVCNDPASPLEISYYYANSQDKTISSALTELFLAYQIGCYIDEYGIMKFLSLSNILSASTGSSVFTMTDAHVEQGGYSVTNSGKVGKISLRYQTPKIAQSLALQNATDPTIKTSPSFIYTTSNTQVWVSGSSDSIGFNYLSPSYTMTPTSNKFMLNVNDLLDIFHTFNLNNNGYVAIENEIVSFQYKEYTLSSPGGSSVTVSVKSDLELASQINKFVKTNQAALTVNNVSVTSMVPGSGTTITVNTASQSFTAGQSFAIDGASPISFNIMGTIDTVVSPTQFTATLTQAITDTYSSGGTVTVNGTYNITVAPTGYITNVQRGMFGTAPATHAPLTSLASKSLSQSQVSSSNALSSSSGAGVSSYHPISSNPSFPVVGMTCPANTKVLLYPSNQVDIGYRTYLTKFNITNNSVFAGGIFFNMPNSSSTTSVPSGTNGTFFVEFIQNALGTQTFTTTNIDGTTGTTTTNIYQYIVAVYKANGTSNTLISWADITAMATQIIGNFENVLIKTTSSNKIPSYAPAQDQSFQLKVAHYVSDGTDGETAGEVVNVFLNNSKVTGWQILDTISTSPLKNNWSVALPNTLTGLPKSPVLGTSVTSNTVFGAYMSTAPVAIAGVSYNTSTSSVAGNIRELYATKKALTERSVNYWYQDSQFLNGLVQGERIFSTYSSYMMQTNPVASGINVYDVQYQTPAATNVDIQPVSYQMFYYPGGAPIDNAYKQSLLVDEYALSYSAPVNTGYRAKFAIANNSPYMVFIDHEPDQLNTGTSKLVLWTHEIVAQSDPEVLEVIINPSNSTEVAQVDSTWIQSRAAAVKMIKIIENAMDGFSRDVTINIFGNPLVQLGDILTFSYPLVGINLQQYVVQSIKHSFKQGLSTTLVINRVGAGTAN